MISQWTSPRLGSSVSQNQRQYEIEVSGKSGFVAPGASFDVGPSSDHPSPGLIGSPLKRWNVSMPMSGLTRTSRISIGRTTTVSRPLRFCAVMTLAAENAASATTLGSIQLDFIFLPPHSLSEGRCSSADKGCQEEIGGRYAGAERMRKERSGTCIRAT